MAVLTTIGSCLWHESVILLGLVIKLTNQWKHFLCGLYNGLKVLQIPGTFPSTAWQASIVGAEFRPPLECREKWANKYR